MISGMRDGFEACVAYLIPMEPVSINKVKADSKKIIGGLVTAVLFDPKLKKGRGGGGHGWNFSGIITGISVRFSNPRSMNLLHGMILRMV